MDCSSPKNCRLDTGTFVGGKPFRFVASEGQIYPRSGRRRRVKYHLILFDFDFTLIDASECLFGALREALNSIGAPNPSDEQIKRLIGIPLARQYMILAGKRDL